MACKKTQHSASSCCDHSDLSSQFAFTVPEYIAPFPLSFRRTPFPVINLRINRWKSDLYTDSTYSFISDNLAIRYQRASRRANASTTRCVYASWWYLYALATRDRQILVFIDAKRRCSSRFAVNKLRCRFRLGFASKRDEVSQRSHLY